MPRFLKSLEDVRYDTLVATFVGACALCVSAYTAHVQRQQVRAMVWPILEYETNNEPIISFTLANRGVGPAIIRRATVKVDDQPVTTWHDALQKLLGPGDHFYSDSTLVGRVLSPGESINILIPDGLDGKRLGVGTSALADLMNKARFRVSIEVCYGSTLGENWILRNDRGARNIVTEVSACPGLSADDFQE